jgi:hypothetical protein
VCSCMKTAAAAAAAAAAAMCCPPFATAVCAGSHIFCAAVSVCSGDEDPLDRVFLYDAGSSTVSKAASTGLDRSGLQFLSNRVSSHHQLTE